MFKVSVSKECGCFKKSDFENNAEFVNKDEALIEATKMTKHMNEEFCQKHNFTLVEDGSQFSIVVADNASTCCGGGHCS